MLVVHTIPFSRKCATIIMPLGTNKRSIERGSIGSLVQGDPAESYACRLMGLKYQMIYLLLRSKL